MPNNDNLTTKEAVGAVAVLLPLAYLIGRKMGKFKTLRQVKKLNRT